MNQSNVNKELINTLNQLYSVEGPLVQVVARMSACIATSPLGDKPYIVYRCYGTNIKLSVAFVSWARDRLGSLTSLLDVGTTGQEVTKNLVKELYQTDMYQLLCLSRSLLEPIIVTLSVHSDKATRLTVKDLLPTALLYMDLGCTGKWIKFMKYQTNWLFCHYNDQEYPEPYDTYHKDGYLCLGVLNNYIRQFMTYKKDGTRSRNLKTLSFCFSVLNGIKKGMPVVSEELINESLREHARNLCKESPDLPEDLKKFVDKHLPSLIDKIHIKDVLQDRPKSCTMRACYENSVSQGGAMWKYLQDYEDIDLFDLDKSTHYYLSFKDFVGMVVGNNTNDHYKTGQFRSDGTPIYSPHTSLYWFAPMDNYCAAVRDTLKLDKVISEAVALPEPLKVRVITKSSYRANSYINCIQKILWRNLMRYPQFQLTGDTVKPETINWLITQSDLQGTGPFFNSGDYSKATDTLSMNMTKLIISHIAGDEDVKKILEQSLCDNIIKYPESSGIPDITMNIGQLMGCLYSFPILCIANFLIYAYSYYKYYPERYQTPLTRLPVLVNGDDILFRDDYLMCKLWEEDIKSVGFQKSIGKNFLSKNFMFINSHMYDSFGNEVPYINTGIIMGKKKGQKSKDLNKLKTVNNHFSEWLSSIQGCSRELYQSGLPESNLIRATYWMMYFRRHQIHQLNLPLSELDGRINCGFKYVRRSSTNKVRFAEEILSKIQVRIS